MVLYGPKCYAAHWRHWDMNKLRDHLLCCYAHISGDVTMNMCLERRSRPLSPWDSQVCLRWGQVFPPGFSKPITEHVGKLIGPISVGCRKALIGNLAPGMDVLTDVLSGCLLPTVPSPVCPVHAAGWQLSSPPSPPLQPSWVCPPINLLHISFCLGMCFAEDLK